MSFTPATSNRELYAVLAVMVVAVVAMLMRRGSGSDQTAMPVAPPDDPEDPTNLVDDDESDDTELGAVTSDGWAFLPDGHEVQLVPPADPDDDLIEAMGRGSPVVIDRNTGALERRVTNLERGADPRRRAIPTGKPGEHFDLGDLTGARVVRGAPSVDPWRLEALGREGEYRSWAFETEDAARAALSLLDSRVVRAPLDPEDGTPRQPGEAEYAAAVALTQAGIADLAIDPGDASSEDEIR